MSFQNQFVRWFSNVSARNTGAHSSHTWAEILANLRPSSVPLRLDWTSSSSNCVCVFFLNLYKRIQYIHRRPKTGWDSFCYSQRKMKNVREIWWHYGVTPVCNCRLGEWRERWIPVEQPTFPYFTINWMRWGFSYSIFFQKHAKFWTISRHM